MSHPRALRLAFALALACLPVVLPGGAPSVARAEEDGADATGDPNDPGYLFYEKQAEKILRAAGDKVWEAAKHAYRSNLFQFAHEQALRALTFDPDQKDAREYLAYEKKGKDWVQNDEDYANLKKQNVRGGANGKQISEEAFEQIIQKWKEERLQKADEYVASRYAKLGDACEAKGYPLQARKGYEYALRLDGENKAARKGLGFKKFGRVWLTEKQDEARKAASKSVEMKEESSFDRMFGVSHNKVESAHFRIESLLPVEELHEIALACETAYAYYLADMGIDPTADIFGGRAQFLYMQDGEQWSTWVKRYSTNYEFTIKLGGTGDGVLTHGSRILPEHTKTLRIDGALHQTLHIMNRRLWRQGNRAWLDEGLAYYYSIKVQETCLHHCVALKKGNYANPGDEGGVKDWQDPQDWKPLVKAMVQAKNDVPLRTIMNQPITKLEFAATIKAWSVITWMMDKDREKFLEFYDYMKNGAKDQEATLQSVWEMGVEELEKAWEAYVKRNY